MGNPRETVPIDTLTFALSSSLTPMLTQCPLEADDEPWQGNGLEGGGSTLDLALEEIVFESIAGCRECLGEGWVEVRCIIMLAPTLTNNMGLPAQ